MTLPWICRQLAGASVLLLVAPATAEESWYRVEIAGQAAGYLVERREVDAETITSTSKLQLTLSRGATPLCIGLESRFVETTGGKPLVMSSRQNMGQVPLEVEVHFGPETARQRSVQGSNVTEQELPLPAGAWLPPAAAERQLREKISAGAERFTLRTVDPLLGARSFDLVYTRLGPPQELLLGGDKVLAQGFRQLSELEGAVEAKMYFDREGKTLRIETELMGLAMVTTLTSEAEARAASTQAAPELLVKSFVRPSRPISSPRTLRRAVYRLRLAGGVSPDLPQTGAQTVLREADAVRVTVEIDGRVPSDQPPSPAYLEVSPYLNFRDPKVEALRLLALGSTPAAAAKRAEKLRAFVHHQLRSKDLATGFATASEVAERLSGDCTEHAVLLAALLRGEGIPARVAAGLLYVEEFAGGRDIFGYHMWAQAWLEGRWVDLDAMTPQAFDATHIALTLSDLNDAEGLLSASAELLQVMGRLSIEVLATEP